MKVIFFTACIAVAIAAELKPDYPAPPTAYPKEQSYPAVPYDFAYAIKDEPTYNDFGRQESSDGKVVKGSYRVALPDGRTQIVTYTADEYGYHADIKYEGEVKYREYKPQASYNTPAPYSKPVYTKAAYPTTTYPKPEAAYSEPLYPTTEAGYQTTETAYSDSTYPTDV